jgi:DNA-binding MarR family transcriptional regulator
VTDSAEEGTGEGAPVSPLATPKPLLEAPGYLVRRMYQAYVATWVRHVDPVLTGPQFAVLVAVEQFPRSDQGSLASAVALDRSTMADIARRMEERGLISRTPDVSDGRRKLLSLTALGERTLTASNERARELDELLLAGMDTAERADVMRVLERLSDRWAGLAGPN